MIEQIEELCTELQVKRLRQSGILHEGSIDILVAWSFHDVSSRIPKSSWIWKRKRGGIEPAFGSWITQVRTAHDIGPIVGAKSQNGSSRSAVIDLREQCDSKRSACLEG